MPVQLDLADIQGNILTAYGKQGFPKGRFMLFHIDRDDLGRRFVLALLPAITTAVRWQSRRNVPVGDKIAERPRVAVNIAFTWHGLLALGVPVRTLRGMPDEFVDGMANRAAVLGDDFFKQRGKFWDEVWTKAGSGYSRHPDRIHVLIMLNAQMSADGTAVGELETKTSEIVELASSNGLRLLAGHNLAGQPRQPFQDLSAILERDGNGDLVPTPKEHFGFTDAIGNPVFEGQYPGGKDRDYAIGQGALDGKGKWRPLAAGEFLLGYPDESQEIAEAAVPLAFSRNGTFMAYRKLHQNAAAFRKFLDRAAADFGTVFGIENVAEARATLMAKMAGRWPDGVPLARAPTAAEWKQFNIDHPESDREARAAALADFAFGDDPDGIKCPPTAHIRRANMRDTQGPLEASGSALNNRHRILRRGLPYGASPDDTRDRDDHGIVMLALCASLARQYEFVQQQWINHGNDAGAGNDTCPIIGNHADRAGQGPKAKFVIPADPASGHPPFIVEGIPQFVEPRGGDYFFVPSMTALRLIGMGIVDPT